MIDRLPGIGGSLFPSRYLADGLPRKAQVGIDERLRRRIATWWARVHESCGPATGVRALFDLVAMPLFAVLGFKARGAVFEHRLARAQLATARETPLGLVVLPWATRPSSTWRDAAATARAGGADWCFVLAPPFLSLVDVRGHAFRRSVDFAWPDALDPRSLAVFWSLAHAASFDPAPDGPAIDGFVTSAAQFQDRVRDDLQHGVIDALQALAAALPRRRAPAQLDARFDEALTLVYRVLFLLFVESRDLVPRRHPTYRGAYALATLCRDALTADSPAGLWDGLAAITRLSRMGCRTDDLIVKPFNGRLFARSAAPSLEDQRRPRRSDAPSPRDRALQRALIALGTRHGPGGREDISYADLGVEQLGAVYERVLDLDPERPRPSSQSGAHSLQRKQSGTFYTPRALAEFVVRRTLAPLVSGASADAILSLRVVDPAMGSGAFLVAACRYLSRAYERALVEEGRCAESDLDTEGRANIRRLVSERCLAGVDANPVAVQLARLSLWLATLAHGKPLGFLDHRLRVGNSLIGASPDDLRSVAGTGRRSAGGPLPLLEDLDVELEHTIGRVARPLCELTTRRDDTIEDVRAKEALWGHLFNERAASGSVGRLRLAASLWCARWFWDEGPPPSAAETRAAIDALVRNDATLGAAHLDRWMARVRSIDASHAFFHWPLEFADVFYEPSGRTRPRPGFDAVIGNPPWEMLRQEPGARDAVKFAARSPAPARQDRIVRFVRESGLYPSCGRGHVNLYQPFVERALTLARAGGRVGLVVPWGLASDDGAGGLRARLLDRAAVDTIVGLDNARGMFPIHRGLRFMVVVASPGAPSREIRGRFGVRTSEELDDLPDGREATADKLSAYPVRLTTRVIEKIGGRTRRIPDVRRGQDLALLERLAADHPPLGHPSGWNARFGRELNATEDRESFGPVGLPVIDGKHLTPFVAHAGASGHRIERDMAARLLPAAPFDRPRLAYRDVSGVANRTSLIAAIVPAGVVTTHTIFCLRNPLPLEQQHFLCALFNSYVLNAVVRMLMGGHLTTSLVESLPVPIWRGQSRERRIARLARRLATRPEARRLAAHLQAAVAELFGLDAVQFGHVLDGFPLVAPDERQRALDALGNGRQRRADAARGGAFTL